MKRCTFDIIITYNKTRKKINGSIINNNNKHVGNKISKKIIYYAKNFL